MKLFHRHTWETVSAGQYDKTYTVYKTGAKYDLGDVTVLLQKCKCGDTRTKQIEGTWTLEDILKEAKDIDKIIDDVIGSYQLTIQPYVSEEAFHQITMEVEDYIDNHYDQNWNTISREEKK